MKPFSLDQIDLHVVYRFADIEKLTGITRQTLRKAGLQGRLVVYPKQPSMTKGEWFVDYLKDRKSVKLNFEGFTGSRKRPQRAA